MSRLLLILLALSTLCPFVFADETGSVRGNVIDSETRLPVVGANVLVVGTKWGGVTDPDGVFTVHHLPVGQYTLQFRSLGYEPQVRTDVIIRTSRSTVLDVVLRPQAVEGEEVSVTAGYFSRADIQPASAIGFSSEEVRRAPGGVGDVSRIMGALPSVAKTNDQYNNLIVRGGTPIENGFFLDNVEIPNINHFSSQGSTGGAIGAINVDLVDDVKFSSGGFGAGFGDRLSAIMEIGLREGSRESFQGQADLGMAGVGTILEGPVGGGKGSWLIGGRRSYTDLLSKIAGFGVSPSYSDAQAKVVVDVGTDHRFSVIDLFLADRNTITENQGRDLDIAVFGNDDVTANTAGLTWRWLLGASGYAITSVSHSLMHYDTDWREAGTGGALLRNASTDQAFRVRSTTHLRLSPAVGIEVGLEGESALADYDVLFGALTDATGHPTPEEHYRRRERTWKAGLSLSVALRPSPRWEAVVGVRGDAFGYQRTGVLSPRFQLSYKAGEGTMLYAAAGRYRQSLPLVVLALNPVNRTLAAPRADHLVVGCSRLLGNDTRLTVEGYLKEYEGMPMDPAQPALFILDEFISRYGFFIDHAPLTSTGRARSRGVEVILQKKLARDVYGMVTAAYSQSRYRDLAGIWRDRLCDNRWSFSAEGGYKLSEQWEFSARWLAAGGPPTTPFDLAASAAVRRGVLDDARVNESRLPDYHCLNVRADRRFHFEHSSLILSLSIWNAYNRKNVAESTWSAVTNAPGVQYQWSLLPVLGVEYEF